MFGVIQKFARWVNRLFRPQASRKLLVPSYPPATQTRVPNRATRPTISPRSSTETASAKIPLNGTVVAKTESHLESSLSESIATLSETRLNGTMLSAEPKILLEKEILSEEEEITTDPTAELSDSLPSAESLDGIEFVSQPTESITKAEAADLELLDQVGDVDEPTLVPTAEHHYEAGLALLRKGKLDDAIAQLQQAIGQDAQNFRAHEALGQAYFRQQQFDEAIGAFQQALQCNVRFAKAYLGLGRVYQRTRQFDQAQQAFQQGIEVNPKLFQAHDALGRIYLQKQQPEAAIDAFQRAIELRPQLAATYEGLGRAYLQVNQADQAIATFQKAVDLNANLFLAHEGLGRVYLQQTQLEQAESAFRRTIELRHKALTAYEGLAQVLLQQQQIDDAIDCLEKALAINPQHAPSRRLLKKVQKQKN